MRYKRYHIIFSTSPLKFKCKICVQKEVIHNFKNHILVTWQAINLLILRKWCGFEKPNHYYFYGGPQLWHQIQITHIKYKILTSNTNYSHQIQNPDIKKKIKRSAVGERKLCPLFTRPWPGRHFVPAHGIVVGMFCSTCGRNVDNCNVCSNCRKVKLKL